MVQQTVPVIFTKDFDAHPWEHISLMRSSAPLAPVLLPQGVPAWFVVRQSLAKTILSDARFGRDIREIEKIFQRQHSTIVNGLPHDDEQSFESNMLNRDGADHRRLRKLSMKAFTPSTVGKLSERISQVCGELIAAFPLDRCFDISAALSYPLPMTMICEILGVPGGKDRQDFKEWSRVMLTRREERTEEELIHAQQSLHHQLSEIIEHKRAQLRHQSPSDLLDELIIARDEKDHLSDKELVTMAVLLLVAGHETTVSLINNSIMRLALTPGLMHELAENPQLIPDFVEEVLRADPPAEYTSVRYAKESFTIGDIPITEGDLYVVSVLAANYDPECYENPEEFNIHRTNGHLAFGHGAHFCLGAALARQEAIIAVGQLVEKFSGITFVPPTDNPSWRPTKTLGSRDEVPVIVHQ